MRFLEVMPIRSVPLALFAALACSACGDTPPRDDAMPSVVQAADSTRTIARDSAPSVEVIPPAAEPAPAVVAPVKPTSSPTKRAAVDAPRTRGPVASKGTPAAARSRGVIASGSSITVANGPKVCSNTLQVGDRLTVSSSSPVIGSNDVAIPAGARVGLVVTKSKVSGSQGNAAELAFDVRNVTFGGETYNLVGSVATEAIVLERKGGDAKKVAVGAAAGAVIGNIIGGGSRAQRTVVGAAAGGLAGAATAALTGDRFACLPAGASLVVSLGSPVTIRN